MKIDSLPISIQDLFNLAQEFSSIDGTCLFHSGGPYDSAEQSFLCLFPDEHVWIQDNRLFHKWGDQNEPVWNEIRNPWEDLKKILFGEAWTGFPLPRWVGYFGYEMGGHSGDKIIPLYPSDYPDAYFVRPSVVIAFDHKKNESRIARAKECSWQPEASIGRLKAPKHVHNQPLILERCESRDSYVRKIKKAKEWIAAGDLYQINLSQQFFMRGNRDPFILFKDVAAINPAPFSAYLKFPHFTIVSSSPERLISKRGSVLETRPIKGTAPRGSNPESDRENKERLLNCAKERAELLMITDLMRNDLAKVSVPGSVETKKIWHCETYSNVFQLLSIIESRVLDGVHPMDIVRAVFPGGSISGCPKVRAIQAIRDLEQRPRGVYTGSIGYFSGNGDFDFNIAIRTLVCRQNRMDLQLGGAIVYDSEPDREIFEIYQKGKSLFQVLEVS